MLAGEATLGLAGAGAITLAAAIIQYTDRVDQIVTQTLYPAICAVARPHRVLFESFVKSNRLALMWGVPFGVGLALFAADLVAPRDRRQVGQRDPAAADLRRADRDRPCGLQLGRLLPRPRRHQADRGRRLVTTVAFLACTAAAADAEGLRGPGRGMAVHVAVHLACRA